MFRNGFCECAIIAVIRRDGSLVHRAILGAHRDGDIIRSWHAPSHGGHWRRLLINTSRNGRHICGILDVPRRSHPISGSGGNSSLPSQRGTSNYPFCPLGTVIDEITCPFDLFWPGISTAIQETWDRYRSCNKTATSQAATPPAALDTPSTPFESVLADFCDYGGCNYLVVGDRLSGWVDIYKTPPGTSYSGATGLIACLRQMFTTLGVPAILSILNSQLPKPPTWGPRAIASYRSHFRSLTEGLKLQPRRLKRTLMDNIGLTGSLDNDGLLRGATQEHTRPRL